MVVVRKTDHDSREDGDASATVRVGYDVTIANAKEGNGNEPHGVEKIGVFLIVVPTRAA